MTRSELEDRIVPDCDLDERGSRVFDFGPRQFSLVLSPELKPLIKEGDGKLKPDLPKPGAKDDAALAAAAVEQWKLLKKTLRDVLKIQVLRLEQAMVTGRRWKPADFDLLIVRHPLLMNLARRLLWACYDVKNAVTATFRVTDEHDYADPDDHQFKIPERSLLGVAHPLELTDEVKQRWGEVFGDYDLMTPFPQLGRPVYRLEKGEAKQVTIDRFNKLKIPATALVGTLERLAWDRGTPMDAGVFEVHSKPFPGANVTAVCSYEEGVPVGYMEGWSDQNLTGCYFLKGVLGPQSWRDTKAALPLGTIPPVAISEVLADLTLLASKGS